MSNWKIDFEVKFSLQFKHINGRIEQKHNSLIVEAVNEEEAKKIVIHLYEDSAFLKIDYVKKLWEY
jgi:hypothetical protein|tara:strand:- start:1693 stop:1890 length:198 start_codon:yes stop_codon:yes gene_type:complete